MSDPLSLFPARIPIGYFIDDKGQKRMVNMTPEFYRALRDVLRALGGPSSDASVDQLMDVFAPVVAQDEGMGDAPIAQPSEAEPMYPDVVQAPEIPSPLAYEMTMQPL